MNRDIFRLIDNEKETADARAARAFMTDTVVRDALVEKIHEFPLEYLDLPLENANINIGWNHIEICLPRVDSQIKDLRERIERLNADTYLEDYSVTEEDDTKSSGNWTFSITKKHSFRSVKIKFTPDITGSTCVRTKIGEEDVIWKRPIYEVTCLEGAAEKVFEDKNNE